MQMRLANAIFTYVAGVRVISPVRISGHNVRAGKAA